MSIVSKGNLIRIGLVLSMIGVVALSFLAGRESGISYGYNRGYLFGYFACRQSDMIMNSKSPGDIHIPAKQLVQENEAFSANERRYQLSAFNDRYLDQEFIAYDKFIVHSATAEK